MLGAALLFPVPVRAQERTAVQWADSARRAIEAANLEGDVNGLVAARALVERALTRFPDDAWLQHYRGYALYREAGLRINRNREKDTDQYLDQAEEALRASAAKLQVPETFALLSSVVGQQIGSNPLKGMTLGPRANGLMDDAMERGPNNPRVWLMRGISAMFTPKMFGGGNDKAESYLRKATELFQKDQVKAPAPAWGHDEAWLWLGRVLEEEGQWDGARRAYEQALQLEPRNGWVREDLLPNFEKRKAQRK